MKAMTIIRMQVIAIGMGAALACTASVKAQEITNTVWPNPNAVAASQVQIAKADVAKADATAKAAPAKAVEADVATSGIWIGREGGWLIGSLAVCVAGLALYALPLSKREQRAREKRQRMSDRHAAVAR